MYLSIHLAVRISNHFGLGAFRRFLCTHVSSLKHATKCLFVKFFLMRPIRFELGKQGPNRLVFGVDFRSFLQISNGQIVFCRSRGLWCDSRECSSAELPLTQFNNTDRVPWCFLRPSQAHHCMLGCFRQTLSSSTCTLVDEHLFTACTYWQY